MRLEDPEFDKLAFFKKLESYIYLILMLPLILFGWAFLEQQHAGGLRSVVFDEPDIMFHSVMGIGVGFILMRTLLAWRRNALRSLDDTPELDVKLQRLFKPIIYRNVMWALGAVIGAYGLYDKGDMVYAMVFTLFLMLITTNRPTGRYFAKLLKLKGEEKTWIEDRKIP